ncbi:hypothetical protein CTI12_AA003340 [Artemisia annua]|uniref:Uncharacterized protein n=1 Tax=Artemisia annua TaxID=35608 RepID=A0A2U1QP89_ARTAN|nr:hypothetical protein CTI12_AA003340 [Artemisia annua]
MTLCSDLVGYLTVSRVDNEFDDVYLMTTLDSIPLEAFTLQVMILNLKFQPLNISKLKSTSSYLLTETLIFKGMVKRTWPCLDENEAYLTTADSAINLLPKATKPVVGWKGVEYKAAFPILNTWCQLLSSRYG